MRSYEFKTFSVLIITFAICFLTGMILDALPETDFNGVDLIVLLTLTTTTFGTTFAGLRSFFKFIREMEFKDKLLERGVYER